MTDYLIDGMLSGTGVRDAINGGYLSPASIGMSASLTSAISEWQQRYENCHFDGFPADLVAELDEKGMALAVKAGAELSEKQIGYYSNGLMKRLA